MCCRLHGLTSSVLVQSDDQRTEASLLWRQAERVGVVQSGEEKSPLSGETLQDLPVPKSGYKRSGEGLLQGHEVKGQGGMALN